MKAALWDKSGLRRDQQIDVPARARISGCRNRFVAWPIPLTEADARVDDKLGKINELGEIQPGHTKKATFDLTPGKCLLFCNEEGLVKAGMITGFTVFPIRPFATGPRKSCTFTVAIR